MTSPSLPPLAGTATLDITDFRRGTRGALSALREVVDYSRRNSTLTLTAKLAGATPAALKGQITNALGTTPLKLPITLDPASVTNALSALKNQLNTVVSINTSTLTAVQAQVNTQINQLTALIAQLRSLSGSGGSGGSGGRSGYSAGTQALLNDLTQLNNEYKRGDVNASAYAARLTTLQASLRTAAGTATAGSAEFRALDAALTRTTQGLQRVQTDGITKLRTELAGARAQFDAAAAAATTLAGKRAAIAAYEGDLNRIRVALSGMASSGQLTAQQLGNVNRLLAQTAREANTIRGGINLAGLSGNVSNALSQLTAFVPGLSQVSGLMTGLNPAVMGVAAALGVFTVAMGASFRTATEFQQVMADVKALTQPTAQGFNDLREAALTMGEPLGVGARAAAAGILELNRAGLSATQVIGGGLTGALNLAGAAGIQLSEASKLGAAAMTAFKLSAADLPRIADNFANFSNSTFLGAEDLSQAIAAVGPVAVNAGLSIEQFGGIMATAAQGGFKTMSDAGTSLKTMLLSLQSPSETGAAALERIGVNAYNADGSFRPFLNTVDDLRVALKGMSEQGRNKVLKDIFGQDAIRVATILIDRNSEAIEQNIATQGKAGEAARVAQERTATFKGEVDRLNAQFERLKIVLGDKLLPVATKFVQGLSAGVGTLERFANGSENLLDYVLPLVAAFVALRGAVIAAAAPAIWASLTAAASAFFATVTAFVAANPLGLVLTGLAALTAGATKIMNDTARIYEQIDQADLERHNNMMGRVKELTDQNTELGRVQARLLLARDRLMQAQEGNVTGVDFWGNVTRTVDPQQVEATRKEVEALTQEVVLLQTEANRRGANNGQVAALDPAKVKEQSEAVRNLRKTLEERSFQLKVGGLDGVEKEVAQVGKAFDDLRVKLKASFGGNLNSNELKASLAELAQAQAKEEAAVRARYAQEKAKERAKEYQQAAAQARQGAFDVQRAEIAAMQDGQARKRAERDLDVAQLRDSVAQQVAEVAKFPDLAAQVQSQGRRQEVALRRQWAQEDQRDARERAVRIAQAFQLAQDGELKARAAARDAQLAQLNLDAARAVARAGQNAEVVAQVERDAQRRRAQLAEQGAREEYAAQRRRLTDTLRAALSAEGLSAQERLALNRQYVADVTALDRQYTAASITRTQEREQAERDAAEKIRQARIAAAFRPAEDARAATRDIERAQQLAQNTADRLAAQRALTGSQEVYAQRLGEVLAAARTLGLTDEQRTQTAEDLKDAQAAVVRSQQQEIDLARQLVQEARDVEGAYTRISLLLTDPAGVRAQQDLALATQDVADAYAEATPYLQRFRTASLKPQDFDAAKTALEGLIAALERQQQKLETLRGEYDRQRTALQGIQDVLRGFGQEFGDMNLLNNAVQFNQGTYDQAQRALNQLLQGGAYDAAQLADATQKLQAAYGGLKDSVVAVGDAQASVLEKEARAIQSATDTKLKAIDAQLARAREAGDEGLVKSLQAERDRIAQEAEAQVTALEARAEAARKAAQQALTDRTRGLQQTLTGVAQGAQRAQAGVANLATQVQQAERDVQGSAQRIRSSLSGAFTGLPGVAATAGRDAGRAFVQQLQTQLTGARLPALTVSGTSAAPGSITYNFGDIHVSAPPTLNPRQIASDVRRELENDLRRNGRNC